MRKKNMRKQDLKEYLKRITENAKQLKDAFKNNDYDLIIDLLEDIDGSSAIIKEYAENKRGF